MGEVIKRSPYLDYEVMMDKTRLIRQLRVDMTDAERRLWYHLRDRRLGGFKFRRQQPIDRFVVDFVCVERRVVVELDGGQHSERVDAERTAVLETAGYFVLRFWNTDVLRQTDIVLQSILTTLRAPVRRSALDFTSPMGRGRRPKAGG